MLFLAVQGSTLFTTTAGGDVLACDTTSCNETVRTIAHEANLSSAHRSYAQPLAADDAAVYYVAVDESDDADAGHTRSRIMKVAR